MALELYAASLYSQGPTFERQSLAAIEATLRDDPDATLDAEQFDLRFTRLFATTRERLGPELARIREERLLARQQQREALRARQQLAVSLMTAPDHEPGNRDWLWVPFGVGQFQNRQYALGVLFASIEAVALAGSITTFVLHQGITTTNGGVSDQTLYANIQLVEAFNYVSVGVLSASVLTGIIQAHFAAPVVRAVPRPLPPSLQNLQISLAPVGPGGPGASLSLRF